MLKRAEVAFIKNDIKEDEIPKPVLSYSSSKAINEKQTQINNATQPILENQGSLKKLTELLNKLEGKIEATTDK